MRMLVGAGLAAALLASHGQADACACAPREGEPVVNADQTVVLVWDPATKTEHFIRRASFKAEAKDFGFLVPTPAEPALEESGDIAFDSLARLTAPEIKYEKMPWSPCAGCSRSKSESRSAAAQAPEAVTVLQEKTVAGFDAKVLEASSASALVGWLKEHGYAYSPEIEAWAKPYVTQGWKITALRVAKPDANASVPSTVAAASLRLTFKTDRPLFPYREPDSAKSAAKVEAHDRLLRIFFVSTERYDGSVAPDAPWDAPVAWSNVLPEGDRDRLARELKLPPGSYPSTWRLTEYEHHWPYRNAPGDLYFAPSKDQSTRKRPPVIEYTQNAIGTGDLAVMGLALVPFVRRRKDPPGAGKTPPPAPGA